MANSISVSGTANIVIGAGGDVDNSLVVFEVTSAVTLAMDVRTLVSGSGATPADTAYLNLRSAPRTFVAAGTDITANGIYGVFAPGLTVSVVPSAGTCTLTVVTVQGNL